MLPYLGYKCCGTKMRKQQKACGGRWSTRDFRGIFDLGHENEIDVAKWRNRKTSQAKGHGKHKSVKQ